MTPFLFTLLSGLTLVGLIVGAIYMVVVIGLIIWAAIDESHWWIPIPALLAVTVFAWIFFHTWLFAAWSVLLFGAIYLVAKTQGTLWKILGVALALVICVFGLLLTNSHINFEGKSKACNPAQNLELTTDGMVVNNIDDGDNSMGTIIMVTRDTPTKDPVVFVIPAGASVDVEYRGDMYFTTDRFDGSLAEGACLADQLYKNVDDKIVVEPDKEAIPAGWKALKAVDGWWKSSTWLYKEDNIEPAGLTATQGIFVSTSQKNRDLVAKEGEVIYGQFWQPPLDGIVTHIQVRSNEKLTIPEGWEGTYWVWTGDFNLGETDLQKRMLQATFHEVVDRDDIKSVTLLSCGTLPPELDKSVYTLYTGESQFGDVTWVSGLASWTCEAMPIK